MLPMGVKFDLNVAEVTVYKTGYTEVLQCKTMRKSARFRVG